MNNTVISSLMHTDDAAHRANIFSVDCRKPTLYMPQYVTMAGVTDPVAPNVISFEVRDQYINAMNNIVLCLELPEIKGVGRLGYVPYVGYKMIRHVSIVSVHGTIWESCGEELFESVRSDPVALELSGYSRELNDINIGLTANDTIKEAASIYVHIKTPFDVEKTFSSLKLADAKVTVTVTFNPIVDVIVYDGTFDIDAFVRDFSYVAEMSFVGYMVRTINNKPSFIEIARKTVSQINQSTAVVTDVHAATSLSVYVKPYYGNTDNRFIAYPGYAQSESDYVSAFVERLVEDLVIVSADYPTGFPDTAQIVEVPASGVVQVQDAEVFVKIDNVPCGMQVYLHTNILVFGTRKNSFVYNLSKKFSVITGVYSSSTNRVIVMNVSHTVNITDASIPVSFWTCQKNVYHGDNRSDASRERDMFVNDPFLKGIDFKNKTDVIARLEVRFGNDVLYSESSPVSRVYNELLTGSRGAVRSLRFNFTPSTFFRPTTISSNPSRGKDKLSVRAIYGTMDPNNPIAHVPKQLVVVCNDLYQVTHETGVRATKVVAEAPAVPRSQ
ncbi:rifampicin resisitance protein [Squirrelpox virus]|uniref:62 kDa protein n=1 Tax=Squirrelpox virus TaxID=240426 RepID=U3UBK9_9POXV|nr:rifampicin resisitance protein [Squirrelpox virus]CCD83270.1 rifampicin resisitance protein [Squirrelpox virus]